MSEWLLYLVLLSVLCDVVMTEAEGREEATEGFTRAEGTHRKLRSDASEAAQFVESIVMEILVECAKIWHIFE
jgi:hypothetical protein